MELKNYRQWRSYCKGGVEDKPTKPSDIPSSPDQKYRDNGWISWSDWLGTGRLGPHDSVWCLFQTAREFVRSLGLTSEAEWRKYRKGDLPDKGLKPDDIPNTPAKVY
ncbi:MAG: hypothetical protein CMD99_03770 [Gammaproteobacteria bacterium]|nr:hypothetical protein [Gammaproteobacteria bacterium]